MISVEKIDSSPWDFTFYKSDAGDYIIKVMFSEGVYKIDVGRYYYLANEIDSSEINHSTLIELANKIRSDPFNYNDKEIAPEEIRVIQA
ncbi:hypothetical protein D781_2800 [Serratia sp. FGI94]|uniref:hypothetical protein n=1 Tax=Serratia sp. FGI94 TaxID=671990 RepID=UPI0002A70DEB|nr:hypothetical protein [Serratia sp. FGI94]AGB83051.1 hypothetical protein D781_2800 [Serratia sp. FGI94]